MRVPFSFWRSSASASFDPLTVGTPLVWYDLAHCTQAAGVVTALPDQSGNGNDATITGGSEPTYSASSASFNNRPVMTFPALDTKYVNVPDLGITTGARTFVAVCGVNVDNAMVVSSAAGFFARGSGGVFDVGDGGSDLMAGSVAAPVVLVWVDNGASSRLYVSALTPVSGTSATPDLTAATMMLGNYASALDPAFSQTGSTAQFLVYNGALSQADCETLLNGFGTDYGIAIAAFDPAAMTPDVWNKGPYAGSPWSPTSPGNTHGNLVANATAPSVLSPGVNGVDAARFNGTTQSLKLSTAYNVYATTAAGFTCVAFINLGTLAGDSANFYDEPPVFTDESGNWALVATTGGVRAGIWNGASVHTTRIALAAGGWAMVAMRYTSSGGGTVKCRVSQLSGTTDQSAVAGTITGVGAELRMGKNYAGSVFLPFDTVEALEWQRVLTDAELDGLKGYFNTVYNQGLT